MLHRERKVVWGIAGLAIAAAGIFLVARNIKTRATPASSPHSDAPQTNSRGAPAAGSLLDQITPKEHDPAADIGSAAGPAPTGAQLEREFAVIAENQQAVNELKAASTRAMREKNSDVVKKSAEQGKQQVSLLDLRLRALQTDLEAARRVRPKDGAVQWLTGELLLIAGGEPQEIRPWLERAAATGLQNPRLFTSLSKVDFESNQFQNAYQYAARALRADNQNRDIWETYAQAAFGLERYNEVIQQVYAALPDDRPPWASAILRNAQGMLLQWKRELALEKAEDKAASLPVVRLTIEHRAFAEGSKQKTTGRGEVTVELFEDQAPAAVANFISLVEQKFYDGTRFHWAEAGRMVVGGDPNTKNDDPEDDGSGGPGYSIPDESDSPLARGHFRGSLSTVQNEPKMTGSQFFITLVPCPEFNGHFTTFGRVVSGQQVLDQVTEGRTNLQVGKFGKIIPGDLLVRAEVIRKRPHRYEATRISQR